MQQSSRIQPLYRQNSSNPICYQLDNVAPNQTSSRHTMSRTFLDVEHPNQIKQEHRNMICSDSCRSQSNAAESLCLGAGKTRNMMGAEVRGLVDGAFDSGYLMTATVNGKVFRGVLFAPGPELVTRGAILSQHPHHIAHSNANSVQNHPVIAYPRHPVKLSWQSSEQTPPIRASADSRAKNELQGVVLTLASPGSDPGRL